MKKLLGKNNIQDALKKLDTLTMEEARMAIAETLKVANRVDDKVDRVDDNVMVLIDGGRMRFSGYLRTPEHTYDSKRERETAKMALSS